MEKEEDESDTIEDVLTDGEEENTPAVSEDPADIFAASTTQSEFDQKLSQLRSKYPNYSVWNDWFDGGHCEIFDIMVSYMYERKSYTLPHVCV